MDPYFLYLLFRFAHSLLEVSTVRMIEFAVCHEQSHDTSPLYKSDCNTVVVHEELARAFEWEMCFDAVPRM